MTRSPSENSASELGLEPRSYDAKGNALSTAHISSSLRHCPFWEYPPCGPYHHWHCCDSVLVLLSSDIFISEVPDLLSSALFSLCSSLLCKPLDKIILTNCQHFTQILPAETFPSGTVSIFGQLLTVRKFLPVLSSGLTSSHCAWLYLLQAMRMTLFHFMYQMMGHT